MNKITVLSDCHGRVNMGIIDALNLAVNYTVTITKEEMLKKAKENYGNFAPEGRGWMEAFEYILSRVNQ